MKLSQKASRRPGERRLAATSVPEEILRAATAKQAILNRLMGACIDCCGSCLPKGDGGELLCARIAVGLFDTVSQEDAARCAVRRLYAEVAGGSRPACAEEEVRQAMPPRQAPPPDPRSEAFANGARARQEGKPITSCREQDPALKEAWRLGWQHLERLVPQPGAEEETGQ